MNKIYSNQKAYKGSGGLGRHIQIPCTEHEILYLENICMQPGIHHITVSSLASGRQMVAQILQALGWHQDIGYLGLNDDLDKKIHLTHIAKILEWPLDQEQLEHFFIHSFYYDFLWIEGSKELYSMPWVHAFEQQLLAYKIDTIIPILILEQL